MPLLTPAETFSLLQSESALLTEDDPSPPVTQQQVWRLLDLVLDLQKDIAAQRETIERLIQVIGS